MATNRGGIDLGGTKIEAIVVDGRHNVLGSSRRPTPSTGGPPDVVSALAGAMGEACEAAAMELRARRKAEKGRKTDLFVLMKERKRTKLTSAVWWHAYEAKDKLARELLGDAVNALGAGIASAVNLLDVEAVVIGGGLGVR